MKPLVTKEELQYCSFFFLLGLPSRKTLHVTQRGAMTGSKSLYYLLELAPCEIRGLANTNILLSVETLNL